MICDTNSGEASSFFGNSATNGNRVCPSTTSPNGLPPIDSTISRIVFAGMPWWASSSASAGFATHAALRSAQPHALVSLDFFQNLSICSPFCLRTLQIIAENQNNHFASEPLNVSLDPHRDRLR